MSRILPGRPKQIEFGTAGLSVLRNIATGHGIHDLQDDRTHRRLRRTVIPILTDTPRQQEEQYTASKQQLYDMYRPVHDRILLQSMPQTPPAGAASAVPARITGAAFPPCYHSTF